MDQLPEERLVSVLRLIRGGADAARRARAAATVARVQERLRGVTGADEELLRCGTATVADAARSFR